MSPRVRKILLADPFMRTCCYTGCGRTDVEWDHALKYAGRQVDEAWAIVPACYYHHRGGGLDRAHTVRIALGRAASGELAKYPKSGWSDMKRNL